jgi:protein-S-isoprenylcysteine O-methyltransferase
MMSSIASALGLIYVASEAVLSLARRAKKDEARAVDRGSLRLLWIVIALSVAAAFSCAPTFPSAALQDAAMWQCVGTALFAAGLALRWYAIVHLGRFFTVNVAIASDHRVIDTGPYRFVRHPSYTGALMAFLGLALCLANWISLAVMMLPIVSVFMLRIHVEEAALVQALGDQYRNYMRRTQRLIPAIY